MNISDLSFFEETCEGFGVCGGDYWGVIAVSSSGVAGSATWNYPTLKRARNVAIRRCENNLGTSCEAEFVFSSETPLDASFV